MYAYDLQRLVNDFPQSGILQALLAQASDNKNLRQASAYFDTRALYKLINAPSSLAGIPDDKIIIERISSNGSYQHQAGAVQNEEVSTIAEETIPELASDYHSVPDIAPVTEIAPVPEIQEETKVEEAVKSEVDEVPPPLPSHEAT